MLKKVTLAATLLLTSLSLHALEITRYVSPSGTGDGMTEQTPTSDLGAMLALGAKVDAITLKVNPGFYSLGIRDTGEGVTYSNVKLDGTWNREKGSSEKVRINFPGVEFVNSSIDNVSFAGGVSISNGYLTNCEADKLMIIDLNNGNGMLKNCKAKGFQVTNWASRSNSLARLEMCSTTGGGGYGLQGKGIGTLLVSDCDFSNNKAGGVNIDGCTTAQFEKCTFSFNSGDGALRLVEFDKSGRAVFSKCDFICNEVTSNHAHNIYVYSNVTFDDCLFCHNTEKDYDRKGIVHLVRPDFQFNNCTFINNNGALELEQFYPSECQINSCAFWGNGSTNIYAGGREDVLLANCAMDHGTGVPELDAEKGILLLTEENKGFEFTGTNVELQPNSVLINQGRSRMPFERDQLNHPRNAFGGTDIGCTEFVSCPGLWQPDSLTINTAEGNYIMAKAHVGNNDYYCLFPEYKRDELEIKSYITDIIYLDKLPVMPKTHMDGALIERHINYNDGFIVDVLAFDNDKFLWVPVAAEAYVSAKERPTVKIIDGEIKFVKPQATQKPASTARKTGSNARKAGSTAHRTGSNGHRNGTRR